MSEQYNINVQPVLNTDALYEQLNQQKYKINVAIDSAALSGQLQSAVNSVTNGAAPAKVPVKFNFDTIVKGMETFNTTVSAFANVQKMASFVSKSLD
ncbi:hypothetical protein [Extibacter muris]|uniref:hypothetical protein n=2 Tax=Extibacter muris TaxID=1796622 RepID=UPI001D067189|nr:hypothetical protein [Extibacter muris]MCB6202770.1 hypothetical protein [Extibacter muris]MCQ4695369.1 hypothetical protein [Extibacter muris]